MSFAPARNPEPHPQRVTGAAAVLRERCALLGLPTWRFDRAGGTISEPDQKGAMGLWLRCGTVGRIVRQAATAWAASKDPGVTEIFPGCYLIPVLETHRRERIGYTAVMALSKRALEDEWFVAACSSAQLDLAAARAAMRSLARYDSGSAEALKSSLSWMVADALRSRDDQDTIAGFTRQLTDGFETIDLLYSLGRSMSDLSRPREFVQNTVRRLQASMSFGWVAVWLGCDEKVRRLAGADLTVESSAPIDTAAFIDLIHKISSETLATGKPLILSELFGQPLPSNTDQLLVQPIMRVGKLIGLILCGDKGGDDPQVSSFDTQLLEAAGGYIGAFLENAVLYADQQAMFLGVLRAMTASIDAKDRYTRGHSERVAYLARRIALDSGLSEATAERLHICGLVHDIGKIGVPEAVLSKPGRLDEREYGLIKMHPEIGYNILKDIPLLEDVLPGVLSHHERPDGKGYPHGLVADAIPLFGRIIALADTFDAMSSNRSYRSALSRTEVLAELQRSAGTQLDPTLVPLLLAMDLTEYDQLVAQHASLAAQSGAFPVHVLQPVPTSPASDANTGRSAA